MEARPVHRHPTTRRREDLGRLSGQSSRSLRSRLAADVLAAEVPQETSLEGQTAAERFVLAVAWPRRSKAVKAIDTYWICTAEHGLNASTFTARIVASTGADAGAALSSAVGALSGPLHGGAPARVLPMLDAVADRETRRSGWPRRSAAASGSWASGIASTAPRIRGRASSSGSRRSSGRRSVEVAEELEQVRQHEAIAKKSPGHSAETNVEYWSAVVLDVAEVPPPLAPAMFACSRTAGWSAHILEQKRLGVARPSLGALHRPRVRAHCRRSRLADVRRLALVVVAALALAGAAPRLTRRRRRRGSEGADQERLRGVLLGRDVLLRSRRPAPGRPEIQVGDPGLPSNPLAKNVSAKVSSVTLAGRGQGEGRLHRQARQARASEADGDRGASRTAPGRSATPASAS